MAYTAVHDKRFDDRPSHTSEMDDQYRKVSGDADFVEHLRTYREFVKGVMLFAGHALAILILLYYFLM